MYRGNEFQVKGVLIKKEYRKAFTREGMHCSELTSLMMHIQFMQLHAYHPVIVLFMQLLYHPVALLCTTYASSVTAS